MQEMDWNDLRYVLAVGRARSFAGAGRILGTDATTVGRRLRNAEIRLHATLFQRDGNGAVVLTAAGELAFARAETIEAEIGGLSQALRGTDLVASGKVRLTAPPFMINRLLLPAAPDLIQRHPGLQLELVGESRNLSLTRREADMAIRLARPADPLGNRVTVRRITTLRYGVYCASRLHAKADDLPWIVYEEGMAHLPHAHWIAARAEKSGRQSPIAVNEAESLLQAVKVGLGRALLPRAIADGFDGISPVDDGDRSLPQREVWLLTHADLRHLARIRAISDWLDKVLAGRRPEKTDPL